MQVVFAQAGNHAAATALNYFAYNFIEIHRTLRPSPAMAAGITERLWSVEDWKAYGRPSLLRQRGYTRGYG
jgi:hypothetical protein